MYLQHCKRTHSTLQGKVEKFALFYWWGNRDRMGRWEKGFWGTEDLRPKLQLGKSQVISQRLSALCGYILKQSRKGEQYILVA